MASKHSLAIERINALAELERVGWQVVPAGDDEVQVRCPVHDDTNPSVMLNIDRNLWQCHAADCHAKGDIVSLLAHILKTDRAVVLADLKKRYDLGSESKAISPEVVERFHEKIWDSGPLLKALYARGLTESDIRQHRLGYHDGRITIPVYDLEKRCVNIRRYLPGAPGPDKMRNTKGYGQPRLYLINQTKYDQVWICGGECKAIVGARLLNPHGVGAICVTAGEGAWDVSFNGLLKGKHIYVCMDVDPGGVSGSRKVASQLTFDAASLHIIKLPLDVTKYPKGDLNDYVGSEKATGDDLLKLMVEAEKFVVDKIDTTIEQPPIEVRLSESTNAKLVGLNIKTDAVIQALDETPYLVPKEVSVSCTRDQPNCSWCPVRSLEPNKDTGRVVLTINGTSSGLLDMVNADKAKQKEALREAMRVPPCKVYTTAVKDYYHVFDVRLTSQLEIGGDNKDHVTQPAMIVDNLIDLNTPYVLGGRVYPNPKNQQAILLLNKVEAAADSLSCFAPTDSELQELMVFRPLTWTLDGIEAKLHEVYCDIENNVTRIYQRRSLHLTLDLAYHSPLYLNIDGHLTNGWVNAIIVGDSSQGKSEASTKLIEHYGLGERVDCKNASSAGLVGGCVPGVGNRWFIQWGIIPTHDKRLVVLEEIKGASTEIIGRLTDMRSSGRAEIPKIEKRRAWARTRLVFVSNPRSDRPVAAYNFGIETIKELIGSLEDIRRFDIADILSAVDVNVTEINRRTMAAEATVPKFNSILCRRRVLWAWTRTATQVRFTPEARNLCLTAAESLCEKFTDALPLIDKGTTRYKLARLAASLAVMTLSTADDDIQTVVVRDCHVAYIVRELEARYSKPSFGYRDFSAAQAFSNAVIDPGIVEKWIKGTKHPSDLVEHLLHAREITLTDLQDWCELERDDAQKLLSLFVRKHAIVREKSYYIKTQEFINLLKRVKAAGLPQTASTSPAQEQF